MRLNVHELRHAINICPRTGSTQFWIPTRRQAFIIPTLTWFPTIYSVIRLAHNLDQHGYIRK